MDQQNKNIANDRKKKRGFSKGRAVLLAVVAVVAVVRKVAEAVPLENLLIKKLNLTMIISSKMT